MPCQGRIPHRLGPWLWGAGDTVVLTVWAELDEVAARRARSASVRIGAVCFIRRPPRPTRAVSALSNVIQGTQYQIVKPLRCRGDGRCGATLAVVTRRGGRKKRTAGRRARGGHRGAGGDR